MKNQQPDKVWGLATASLSPTSFSALRLKYCLADLAGVKGRILEVGCGAGMFAKAIKKIRPDLEVFGCDLNQEAIVSAKRQPAGISFRTASVYKLPYTSASFDAVISFDVLEHLDTPARALREINRVLKQSGLLHLFVPMEGDMYTIQGLVRKLGYIPKIKYAGHVQQYHSTEFNQLLTQAGFTLNRIRFSSHYFMQSVDMAYFTLVAIFHIKLATTIEGYLENPNLSRDPVIKLLGFVKRVIAVISYCESSLVPFFPAQGAHFTLTKK